VSRVRAKSDKERNSSVEVPAHAAGQVDVALVFGHADTPREDEGFRLAHLLDDPLLDRRTLLA